MHVLSHEKLTEKKVYNEIDEEEKLFLSSMESKRSKINDYFSIGLAIDGGGARGIIPAIFLDQLSKSTGKRIHELFNCIGGTSIGGIIALSLSGSLDGKTPLCTTDDCVQVFQNYGKLIFGKHKSKYDSIGLTINKYDESGLESMLSHYMGDAKLSDCLTNVLVTSVKATSNEMVIFKSSNAFRDINEDFLLRNCARATSAAPTFFSAAEFNNLNGTQSYKLIDGGVGKNDPSPFVLNELKMHASTLGTPNNYFLLSLGTGETLQEKNITSTAGLFESKNLLFKCMAAHNELDQQQIMQNEGKTKYRRFQLLWDTEKNQIHSKLANSSLDNTEQEVLKLYQEQAKELAENIFMNDYGPYSDRTLVDWLLENYQRKAELF